MKSLSPSRPYVIFVIGKPGVGKTQFASKFAEMFNTPYIEADAIRHTITENPTYSSTEQDVVDRLLTMQMNALFKTKATFIIEGGTEAKVVRQNLAKFAKTNGYESLFVWIQTDRNTAYIRATKPTRQNSHKLFLLSQERFEKMERRFTNPGDGEQYVVISGKHTPVAQIKTVLKRLAADSRPTTSAQLTIPARQTPRGNSIRIS